MMAGHSLPTQAPQGPVLSFCEYSGIVYQIIDFKSLEAK